MNVDVVLVVSWPSGRKTYSRTLTFVGLPDDATPDDVRKVAETEEPALARLGPVYVSQIDEGPVTITFAALYDEVRQQVNLEAWTAQPIGDAE